MPQLMAGNARLTRACSRASVFDIATIAALVELYSEFLDISAVVASVLMLTMPPPPVSAIRRAAAPQSVIVPITFSWTLSA